MDRNFEETSSLMCCTFGKRSGVKNYGVLETLTECYPFNEQLIQIFKSLEYINKLRIIFKKRNIPFLDVEEELKKFDKVQYFSTSKVFVKCNLFLCKFTHTYIISSYKKKNTLINSSI